MKTEYIIKILQLKNLGRKSAFLICDFFKDISIADDQDLKKAVLKFISLKKGRLPLYSEADFNKAFQRGDEIIEESHKRGINITSYYDSDYPQSLKEIDDSPILLNFKGDYKRLNDLNGVAIIGTRNPTPEGIKSGEFLGEYFGSNGFNIVSGLAKGCDTAAHVGCLRGRGFTTAIVAHGLHTVYPKENKGLAEEIIDSGGVLMSEYFTGTGALANYFIERDRLQAGLSKATIVVQTGLKGGTWYAVDATQKSGKPLAAILYKSLNSDQIEGNNLLINENRAYPLTRDNLYIMIERIR